MSYAHAIVWLDHRTARVISFSLGKSETVEIDSMSEERRLHRKSGIPGSGHAPDDHDFFDEIVAVIADVPEVLVAGPGTAKKAFERHVRARYPKMAHRFVGVETLDHPTEHELLAHARKYFKRIDQLGIY